MTRTRRSLYTLAASYLYTGVTLVSGLVAAPLLLDWLGDVRVGLARVAQQWLGILLMLGMSLDACVAVLYSRAAAVGDRDAMLRALRGGLRAYLGVLFVGVLWCGLLWCFAARLFNVDDPDLFAELRNGLIIAAAGQLALLFAAFKPLAEAEQRGYVANISLALGALGGMILALTLAAHGGGLAGQILAIVAVPLIGNLLMTADALRRYPDLLRHPGGAVTRVDSFNGPMLAYQAIGRFSFFCDAIIVNLVLGNDAVVPFTQTQALLFMLHTVCLSIGNSAWPALANLHNGGRHDAFNHRLIQLTRFVTIFGCALLVPAAVWDGPFVIAWVEKPSRFAGSTLAFLTAAVYVLAAVTALWAWPIVATGRVRKILPYFAIGGAVNLAVCILATGWLGTDGPPIGALLNYAGIIVWCYPLVIQREFGTPARKLILAALGPMLLAVPYAVAWWLIGTQVDLPAIVPGRLARMATVGALIGIGAAGYIVLAMRFTVPVADRREWWNRFRRGQST